MRYIERLRPGRRAGAVTTGRGLGTAVLLLVAASACSQAEPPTATAAQPLSGASNDNAEHPAVCGLQIVLPPDPERPGAGDEPRRCSCSLVGPDVVLTAASCVAENFAAGWLDKITVSFGGSFSDLPQYGVTADSVLHRYYREEAPGPYDLALLRLSSVPPVSPVTLNAAPLGPAQVDQSIVLVGYGETGDDTGDFGRRRVLNTTVRRIDPYHLLAGERSATSCAGDGGGPGFMNLGAGLVQVSVTVDQGRCFDNALRLRVDRHLGEFIHRYVDRFAGACKQDGSCVQTGCRSPDPDCDPCSWNGSCAAACPEPDWDCELGHFVGEGCASDAECEESGRCVPADDDPAFLYCTRPCDPAEVNPCPPNMACSESEGGHTCTYLTPSTGSQGYACVGPTECRSGICEDGICAMPCDVGSADSCPAPYLCTASRTAPGQTVCLAQASGDGGFCALAAPASRRGGGDAWWALLLVGLAAGLRSARRGLRARR